MSMCVYVCGIEMDQLGCNVEPHRFSLGLQSLLRDAVVGIDNGRCCWFLKRFVAACCRSKWNAGRRLCDGC